jgi:hypothetical protein
MDIRKQSRFFLVQSALQNTEQDTEQKVCHCTADHRADTEQQVCTADCRADTEQQVCFYYSESRSVRSPSRWNCVGCKSVRQIAIPLELAAWAARKPIGVRSPSRWKCVGCKKVDRCQIAIPLELRGVQESRSVSDRHPAGIAWGVGCKKVDRCQIAIPLELRGVRSACKPTCWSLSYWILDAGTNRQQLQDLGCLSAPGEGCPLGGPPSYCLTRGWIWRHHRTEATSRHGA